MAYHLMYETVVDGGGGEWALMARSIRRVIDGFVGHCAYVRAAHSAATTLSATEAARRLVLNIDTDANPIAGLSISARENGEFARRWNEFNRQTALGVKTRIGRDSARALLIARKPQTSEPDAPFRAELVSQCVELLSSQARRGIAVDGQDRLMSIAGMLGLSHTVVADLIALLYTGPVMELNDCARLLGCHGRTLQRELSRHDLWFGQVRQAVRLTIAGFRLRNVDEPITLTAQAAGFFDSAHLNHAWHASCHIPPSAYRSLMRPALPPLLPGRHICGRPGAARRAICRRRD